MTDAASARRVHFATSLMPHRSLSPEGFKWLIGPPSPPTWRSACRCWSFGAWPVVGFLGLDVWLLWFLFKRSYLDARRSETLVLTDRELMVERVAPDGEREEHRLEPTGCASSAARPSGWSWSRTAIAS